MLYSVTICRKGDSWTCDDKAHSVHCAPFSQGVSEMLSELQLRLGIPGETLTMTFSDNPFLDHQLALKWTGSCSDSSLNTYCVSILRMKVAVSFLIRTYFRQVPRVLYLSIDVCEESL